MQRLEECLQLPKAILSRIPATLLAQIQGLDVVLVRRAAGVLVLGFLALRLLRARGHLQRIGFFPGLRVAVTPMFPFPLPNIPLLSMEAEWPVRLKHQPYARAGTDVLSVASIFPTEVAYVVADPVTIKEMFRSKQFPKPVERMDLVNVFGPNIVVSEGFDYKRHRIAAQGSFTEPNNRLVWATAVRSAELLLDSEHWRGKTVVEINESTDICVPLALQIIASAGFGRPLSAKKDANVPPGHVMPFDEAVETVANNIVPRVLIPKWARRLTASFRHIDDGFSDVEATAAELVAERRGLPADDRDDLFSALVAAADEPADERMRLTDQELVTDVIAFLMAGHETTAHSLSVTLGLLALYPDEQEKVFQEVVEYQRVAGEVPEYENASKLVRTLAVIYETLRMYPPIPLISKKAATDTVLPLAFPTPGGAMSFVAPAETYICIHMQGLHYNPRYWKDPHLFRPERFLDPNWPRDAFAAFSGGPRVCLGKRFAETEAVALLAALVLRFRIELRPGHPGLGEKDEVRRREAALRVKQGLTLHPVGLPLVFRRRTPAA